MGADVHPENFNLGADLFGRVHLRQPAGDDQIGGVGQVQCQLGGMVLRPAHRGRRLRLAARGGGRIPRVGGRGHHPRLLRRRPDPPSPLQGTGVAVQIGQVQQQVAAGDAVDPGTTTDAVQSVEPAGEHEPLRDRPTHGAPLPEVGQRLVGPGCHDADRLSL